MDETNIVTLSESDRSLLEEIERILLSMRETEEKISGGEETIQEQPRIGLYGLYEALIAQRHELKLYTKASRSLEEANGKAIEAMEKASGEYRDFQVRTLQAANRTEEAVFEALKPAILALTECEEAIARISDAFQDVRLGIQDAVGKILTKQAEETRSTISPFRRFLLGNSLDSVFVRMREPLSRELEDMLSSLVEGFELLRTRIERLFSRHGIVRIGAPGKPVDPETMNTVSLLARSDLPPDSPPIQPGHIAQVLRYGYKWKNKIIRFAEIIVLKSE